MMLSYRDFCGEEHYKWGKQEYDNARHYLKTCGKPKDDYDVWLIKFHKETEGLFQRYK